MANEIPENMIIVGKKPISAYMLAIATHVTKGTKEIIIRAMGRNITKAVNIVNRARSSVAEAYKIGDVKIDTAEIELDGGRKRNVSVIEIKLKK